MHSSPILLLFFLAMVYGDLNTDPDLESRVNGTLQYVHSSECEDNARQYFQTSLRDQDNPCKIFKRPAIRDEFKKQTKCRQTDYKFLLDAICNTEVHAMRTRVAAALNWMHSSECQAKGKSFLLSHANIEQPCEIFKRPAVQIDFETQTSCSAFDRTLLTDAMCNDYDLQRRMNVAETLTYLHSEKCRDKAATFLLEHIDGEEDPCDSFRCPKVKAKFMDETPCSNDEYSHLEDALCFAS